MRLRGRVLRGRMLRGALPVLIALASSGHVAFVARLLPDCPQEDSRNCYWDAGTSGNGIGHSFIDLRGKVYYTGAVHRGKG